MTNKIDGSLAKLIKEGRGEERTQIYKQPRLKEIVATDASDDREIIERITNNFMVINVTSDMDKSLKNVTNYLSKPQ